MFLFDPRVYKDRYVARIFETFRDLQFCKTNKAVQDIRPKQKGGREGYPVQASIV